MPRGRSLWETREVKCGGGKGLENRLVPVSVQPENCPGRHSLSLQEGSLKPPEQFCCSCRAFELSRIPAAPDLLYMVSPGPVHIRFLPFPATIALFKYPHMELFPQSKGLCSIILLTLYNLRALVPATQELVLYSGFDRQAAGQV